MAQIIAFIKTLFGISKVLKLDEKLLAALAANPSNEGLLRKVLSHLKLFSDKDREGLIAEILHRKRDKDEGPRKQWENQIANQVVEPLQYCKPTNFGELNDILQQAITQKLTVKPAGSGHSYSDVATTRDFFIDTHGLDRPETAGSITGQLRDEDKKPQWRRQAMLDKWQSLDGMAEVLVDSKLSYIDEVRDKAEGSTLLFETEGGITLKELNRALNTANPPLGLPNMGGYDGQTIMGAISTSTHGSGIALGPFPDMLRSLILVTTGEWKGPIASGITKPNQQVFYYRIEPSDGITDPDSYRTNQAKYQYNGHDIQLIQDDQCFQAVMVNFGTMGVVYSVVAEVYADYYMTETRDVLTLKDFVASLKDDPDGKGVPDILRRYRNYGCMMSPYPMKDNKLIEMDPNKPISDYYEYFTVADYKRNITPPPEGNVNHDANTKPRNPITAFLGQFEIGFEILSAIINLIPSIIPHVVQRSTESLADKNYVKKYEDIYMTGVDGKAGFATEIGFPVQDENGQFTIEYMMPAIDEIIRVCQQARLQGEQYQSSPFAIRFVKQSKAYMSMMNDVDTVMLELDMVTGTYAGEEVVNRQQNHLYKLGGRPHWGLEFDQLTGNNELLSRMYPNYPQWKEVYDQFNHHGTFNNNTTNRLGLSKPGFTRGEQLA